MDLLVVTSIEWGPSFNPQNPSSIAFGNSYNPHRIGTFLKPAFFGGALTFYGFLL
jgi:hypothetical protein